MAGSSSSWLETAMQAKQTTIVEQHDIITYINGYAPIPPCTTFMKYHEILSPDNKNMAEDIDANPGVLALTHVVCWQCNEKVSVKDIGQRNKHSLEKRLREIWQGRETIPMKRRVVCISCSAPKNPVQALNEHCQKHGYMLHMSLQMLVSTPDFSTQMTCNWELGQSEATAKQHLAECMLRQIREEETKAKATKKRHAGQVGEQSLYSVIKSLKPNPEIDEWMSDTGSGSD